VTANVLLARRLGVDTYRRAIIFMRTDCAVCRSEGFEAPARVWIEGPNGGIVATLNVVTSHLLDPGEAGLSEEA
jgi:thymidine phosphorylase